MPEQIVAIAKFVPKPEDGEFVQVGKWESVAVGDPERNRV